MAVCKATEAPRGGRMGRAPGRPAGEQRREGIVITHAGTHSLSTFVH